MPLPVNYQQHLADLWLMPEPLFRRYVETVNSIARWRSGSSENTSTSPAASSAEIPAIVSSVSTPIAIPSPSPIVAPAAPTAIPPVRPSVKSLPRRAPMRPPKPGSLRGIVHQLLRSTGKPLKRSAIIEAVAAKRGARIDDNFKVAVGEVLTNQFDLAIGKVSHGVYSYHLIEEKLPMQIERPTTVRISPNLTKPQRKAVVPGGRPDCIIRLFGPIDMQSVQPVMEALLGFGNDGQDPIVLHIASPGGCVNAGMALIDVMEHVSPPVFTVAMGMSASIAAVILVSGQGGYRYCLEHTRIMLHLIAAQSARRLESVESAARLHRELDREVEALLLERMNISRSRLRTLLRQERFLDAKEACALGFVDQIL